jgi:hypothetical protein
VSEGQMMESTNEQMETDAKNQATNDSDNNSVDSLNDIWNSSPNRQAIATDLHRQETPIDEFDSDIDDTDIEALLQRPEHCL